MPVKTTLPVKTLVTLSNVALKESYRLVGLLLIIHSRAIRFKSNAVMEDVIALWSWVISRSGGVSGTGKMGAVFTGTKNLNPSKDIELVL